MMHEDHRTKQRSACGGMLIEVMVATILLGVVAAGLVSLVVINNTQSQRLLNKVDTINDARQAVEQISRNWRMARSVGDLYGAYQAPSEPLILNSAPDGPSDDASQVTSNEAAAQNLEDGTATLSSASFPSNGDPAWGGGQIPSGGWPWSSRPFPYRLSTTTLIIQVPVFSGETATKPGYPQALNGAVVNLEAVDTYVYQVLPDPENEGQFILQVAGFPGAGSSMHMTATPQTILRGIVGPFDSNGNLVSFQYISRINPTVLQSTVADGTVSGITGLVMTFELLRSKEGPQPATVGLKNEVFMRNNSLSTVIGS